jgi:hypothetical protein
MARLAAPNFHPIGTTRFTVYGPQSTAAQSRASFQTQAFKYEFFSEFMSECFSGLISFDFNQIQLLVLFEY